MDKQKKERIMTYLTFAAASVVVASAVVVGCQNAGPTPPPAQAYEIARGSNFIAQTTETIEVQADLHLADRPDPVRVTLRIRPGTWVVPEQMLRIGPDAPGIVCDDKVCEVVR